MSDARARHDSLSRILAVQAQKRRLAQWKDADFRRRAREVADAEAATIAALNSGGPLADLFTEQAAKRLESLARKRRSLDDAIARQGELVRAEARREKAAEILAEDAARKLAAERRRREDLEALEAFLAAGDADPTG